jgi:hypothetical protein
MKIKILRDFSGSIFGCDHPLGDTRYDCKAGQEVDMSEVEASQLVALGVCECEAAPEDEKPVAVDAVAELKQKYTVAELRKMYEEKTGNKPGRMREQELAEAIAETKGGE